MTKITRKDGFSLIEAAIVLGIVGLVIGGIWVASAAVSKRLQINDMIITLSMVMDKVSKNKRVWDGQPSGFEIRDILSTQQYPGGFAFDPYKLSAAGLEMEGINYTPGFGVGMFANFVRNSTPAYDGPKCAALTSFLLSKTFSSGGYLVWMEGDYATGLGNWNVGDVKPTPSQYAAWCATTGRINVGGLMP